MVAIQVGVREAARAFDLSESTVQTWSRKEGWMTEAVETKAIADARKELRAVPSKTASEVIVKYGDKTKLKLSKATYKTSNALSKLPEEHLLGHTQALVNTVNAAAKLHNWQAPANQTLVNINLTGQRFDRAD